MFYSILCQLNNLGSLGVSKGALTGELDGKLYCPTCPYLVAYLYISIYLPYVHILESTREILWTRLINLKISRKVAIDMLVSEMFVNGEENSYRFKEQGKKLGYTHGRHGK